MKQVMTLQLVTSSSSNLLPVIRHQVEVLLLQINCPQCCTYSVGEGKESTNDGDARQDEGCPAKLVEHKLVLGHQCILLIRVLHTLHL